MASSSSANSTTAAGGFWRSAPALLADLDQAAADLAASREVTDSVILAVHRLAEETAPLTPEAFGGADPYLIEALLTAVIACANAAWLGDRVKQRRELRVPLERARQALGDLLAERDVAADQPPKQLARWLVRTTGLPQQDLAQLAGVATRTFQRWVSDTESAAPAGDDETRMRTLARVIDQLRWSMTAAGAVRWLNRPHPQLAGRSPAALLGEPGAYAELPRLAAATRAMVAD